MDLLSVLLLVGLLLAAGAAVWLAVERGKAGSAAAVARSERDGAVNAEAAARAELAACRKSLDSLAERIEDMGSQMAAHDVARAQLQGQLEKEREVHQERQAALTRRETDLKRSIGELTEEFKSVFGKLSGDALKGASEQFLRLAESKLKEQQTASVAELEQRKTSVDALIKPMGEALRRTEERLAGLAAASGELRAETGKLVRALSRPEVRGRYGEVQLRRVAELAGMVAYCDFSEQASARDGDGRLQRPDMIVRLPNERVVAVDAKCNIDSYVKAAETGDEAEREQLLTKFADHVCEQVSKLSAKSYWSAWEGSPEFVVMFVPGDQFLDAALSRCPELMEQAAEQSVILASPSTLIGLLRAVAVGWRETRVEEQRGSCLRWARSCTSGRAWRSARWRTWGRRSSRRPSGTTRWWGRSSRGCCRRCGGLRTGGCGARRSCLKCPRLRRPYGNRLCSRKTWRHKGLEKKRARGHQASRHEAKRRVPGPLDPRGTLGLGCHAGHLEEPH